MSTIVSGPRALLELKDITVSFDGFLALRDLNLSLEPGELRAVIGPNGAGKTTFLDVITGKSHLALVVCFLKVDLWLESPNIALLGLVLVGNSKARVCLKI